MDSRIHPQRLCSGLYTDNEILDISNFSVRYIRVGNMYSAFVILYSRLPGDIRAGYERIGPYSGDCKIGNAEWWPSRWLVPKSELAIYLAKRATVAFHIVLWPQSQHKESWSERKSLSKFRSLPNISKATAQTVNGSDHSITDVYMCDVGKSRRYTRFRCKTANPKKFWVIMKSKASNCYLLSHTRKEWENVFYLLEYHPFMSMKTID